MKKEYKPTKNGRASICTWELEFYYRTEEQIRDFVNLLIQDEIFFDFECEKVLDSSEELYYITVKGSWANNLVRVAEMAEKVDYRIDI